MTGLIGRKLGMTRVFDAEGTHVPVTIIEAGPCPVVQVGQTQVQLGFGAKKPKRTAKALAGHVKKVGLETAPRVLHSFPVAGEAPKAGETLTVAIFAFTLSMQDFVYALTFVSSSDQKVVTIGVVTELIRGDVFFWGSLMGGALIAGIPVAILYSFFLDYFVRGITGGAVK